MKTIYIDCGMGAAGDMLTAALLDLLPDPDSFIEEMNSLGIPKVTIQKEAAAKCGICGTHVTVKVDGVEEESEDWPGEAHHHDQEPEHEHHHDHDHEHHHDHEHDHHHEHHHGHDHDHEHHHDHAHTHHHSSLADIAQIVGALQLPEGVKQDVLAVYQLIAEAESHTHGIPVTQIHFHEVGTLDAVADITAVCLLMAKLAPEQVIVSPIHVGSGQVRCAHGILPVPAPATAWILRDVPMYGGSIQGELCTPTGAALLKHFATCFGSMPVMKTTAIGYGMGKKDFPAANCVRVLLGETENAGDQIVELQCNLDDMTAEALGFAQEQFFAAGAVEVYTTPIQMKKSRPGVLLSVMCQEKDKEKLVQLLFRHTTTLGIRETTSRRYTLERSIRTEPTEFGPVHVKTASGYGVTREKVEYEDLARIAREQNLSLAQVRERLGKK